jgi:hypothetical protein
LVQRVTVYFHLATRAQFEKLFYTCNVGRGFGGANTSGEAREQGDDPDALAPAAEVLGDQANVQCSVDVKLMVEFLDAAVAEYDTISIATPNADQCFKMYQVLAKGRRNILIKTFDSEPVMPVRLCWTVQPYEVWRGDEYTSVPDSLDAFVVSESLDVNIVGETGSDAAGRSSILKWKPGESDISGCTSFGNAAVVKPPQTLGDPKVPVLSLVDALDAAGFIAVQRLVVHSPTSGLFFDSRNLASKRTYLQAVLQSAALWAKGVKSFRSDASSAFYNVLMKSPTPISQRLSAKECMDLLKELDPSSVQSMSDEVAPTPAIVRPQPFQALCDIMIDGDDEVGAIAAPAENSTSSSSSSSSKSSCNVDGEDEVEPYPTEVEGAPCRIERHQNRHDVGLRVQCQCIGHGDGCELYRSCKLQVATFGSKAAQYFVGTWLKAGSRFSTTAAHKAYKPTIADVRAYIQQLE